MHISVNNLSVSLQGQPVLSDISLHLTPRSTVGLTGPNGSGKSTLMRCLSGLFPAHRKQVKVAGNALSTLSQRDLARHIAFVPQHAQADPGMRVDDIIRLGRTPHRGAFAPWTAGDEQAVNAATAQMALEPLQHKRWHQLSGGEKQRCQIARALAQQPAILLLDEPTNHLDIQHQLALMALIASLPVTVIIALHDLNLAAHYCDTVVVLQKGKLVGCGKPADILTPEAIRSTWQVNAQVSPAANGQADVRYLFPERRISSSILKVAY